MKPIVFLDFDGVVETIYWEKDKDGSWSYNIHKYGRDELNNKQANWYDSNITSTTWFRNTTMD